ncbi:unnamed protein product [Microthlaspi erraticum]|uniref:PHD-type domain-containing protein n=1 Tax=Microthlaspi erraticum TaxID=1685480 RepID=A0A6D2JJK2_9BRAS|nr:unnamed protein product [Microthlaspi erraticum]
MVAGFLVVGGSLLNSLTWPKSEIYIMPKRKGISETEEDNVKQKAFTFVDLENVIEMKNKKTVKVKPIDREVNITRSVLRSGSVVKDTANSEKHHEAVEEKRKGVCNGDLSKGDTFNGGVGSIDEVREEKDLECPVTKEAHEDDDLRSQIEVEHEDDRSDDGNVSVEPHLKVESKRGRPRKLQTSSQSGDDVETHIGISCVEEEKTEAKLDNEEERTEVKLDQEERTEVKLECGQSAEEKKTLEADFRGQEDKEEKTEVKLDKEEKLEVKLDNIEERTEVKLECGQSAEEKKTLEAVFRRQVEFEIKDDRSNGKVEPHGEELKVKRKRGRPKKFQVSSQADESGSKTNLKLEGTPDLSSQSSVDRLSSKPKRGRPPKTKGTSIGLYIEKENVDCGDGSTVITPDQSVSDSIDESRRPRRNNAGRAKGLESDEGYCWGTKMVRKRGRPPTPKKKRKSGETDESDCRATKRVKLCESPLESRHNKPLSDGEMMIGEQQSVDGSRSKSESKKKLSDKILQLLLAAGWTVEHRPRNGRAYKDAVYVNPEGKTHWSVTKAYQGYKTNLESSMKDQMDSTTGSGFGLLPEEDLHLLGRRIQKKRSDTGKPRLNWKDINTSGNMVSTKGIGKKAQKKRKGSHGSQNVERISVSVRKIKREEKHSRKRGALSARSSLENANSMENGYILFEGKRTMLGWMIDSGIVPLNGKVQSTNCENTEVRFEGIVTKEGIRCNCCDEVFSVLDFEVHSGGKHKQPFRSLSLEGGNSLLQCFLESWNKQSEPVLKGFHTVDFGSGDQNDDTCAICGDGGDLTCCDGCPSTFHQSCLGIKKFPSGAWFCCYCSCKFCEKVEAANHDTTTPTPLLRCHLCEEKYHQTCIKEEAMVPGEQSTHSFCGTYCQELFEGLQLLIGVKHPLPEGFSWTFLRRFDIPREVSDCDISEKIAHNAKLPVAFSVMDECFSPLVDHRSGVNLLENIVYNFGSNFHRLNYSNFLTAVLEKGDEIIAVASIRIHGNQLAEMPFIGTRYVYRRQGMCRRLMNGIESALGSLKVDKLVIPAVPELTDTWTSGFGFRPVHELEKKTIQNLNLVVFPGVDMLEKPLAKEKIANGEKLLAPERSLPVDVEETKPEESKDSTHEQKCAAADVEPTSDPVDSCLKSMNVVEEGDNDADSNLKLLNGSFEEKEERIGKLTDKDVDSLPETSDNQRESNSGVADDSHTPADQTDTKGPESGELEDKTRLSDDSSKVKADEDSKELDDQSDCCIVEQSQPLGGNSGGTEKTIRKKALVLNTGVASRLRVSPRSWRPSRVSKRYTGTDAVLLDSSHRRCV